jgi:hypothetical protein
VLTNPRSYNRKVQPEQKSLKKTAPLAKWITHHFPKVRIRGSNPRRRVYRRGAEEARGADNPEDVRSKRTAGTPRHKTRLLQSPPRNFPHVRKECWPDPPSPWNRRWFESSLWVQDPIFQPNERKARQSCSRAIRTGTTRSGKLATNTPHFTKSRGIFILTPTLRCKSSGMACSCSCCRVTVKNNARCCG